MNKKAFMVSSTLLMLSACMPTVKSVTTDVNKPVVLQALNQPLPVASKTGSLWSEGSIDIFSDPKATHVGDLVTILVNEQASATRKLGTKKNRKSSRKTDLTAGFGYLAAIKAKGNTLNPSAGLDIADAKSFDGSGSTTNSDTLTASVTAVVTKVFPNGNMEVMGRRQVTINHQPQELVFTGIIRPLDVSPDNTIPSSKVAQAIVSYGSGGELATVAQEGWLSRSLDQVWPF